MQVHSVKAGRPAKGLRCSIGVLLEPEDVGGVRALAGVLSASLAEVVSGLILTGVRQSERNDLLTRVSELEHAVDADHFRSRVPVALHAATKSVGEDLGDVPITLVGGALIRFGLQNLGTDFRTAVADAAAIALNPDSVEHLLAPIKEGLQLVI